MRDAFEQLTADAITAYPTPAAETADLVGFAPFSADIARLPLEMMTGRIEVFADDPEKVTGHAEKGGDATTVTARVGQAMSQAKTEVVVGSPYFIPGQLGMDGMKTARATA